MSSPKKYETRTRKAKQRAVENPEENEKDAKDSKLDKKKEDSEYDDANDLIDPENDNDSASLASERSSE